MKRVARTILLLLFTLYANGGPAAWVVYALYADSIAAAYCVNPDRPSCHGKCHVSTVANEERSQTTPSIQVMIEKSLPAPVLLVDAPRLIITDSPIVPRATGRALAGHPASVYHPPLSLC